MKQIFVFVCIFMMSFVVANAQNTKTDTIKVRGECGMCKNRIEKALNIEGITEASWDDETELLVVTYNPAVITNDAIQKKVASVGHDTEKYKAEEAVYKKLPGCCKYDRKESQEKEPKKHKH